MCIILFAYQAHPQYHLLVAANRDEFYNRPTEVAAFWADNQQVLAGRDREQMGTWMGVTKNGRFAALTNYRDPYSVNNHALSRGELVKQYLIIEDDPAEYLAKVQKNRQQYNGFNLLVGDTQHLFYYSKQDNVIMELEPGIYGLSNASLNTPWPKIQKGRRVLGELLKDHSAEISKETVFQLLADVEGVEDKYLPNTGVGLEWERILSPIFIESPDYGTRSSTLLTIRHDGWVEYVERTFHDGKPSGDAQFLFQHS
ncbi:MAG TPA: NRDE family protein [Bacillota bacterium]|nr:NRDE family protein [Bacillota bacterium]